jgi:nucleoside-diphosphate-sugar epimerase
VPTVAITGASGFVGGHLVKHFAGRGWDVVALARRPVAGGERVRWARYDLAAAPPDQLLAGVDALVHAAYVKADASPDAYRLNVDGTAALLRARRAAGVSRAVFFSSLSARPGATSVYARQKLDAEALFAAGGDAVIRAGLVLGPGGLAGDTVALMRRVRVVPLIGGGRQPVQPVGVEDLATIVERILTRDDLTGTYVVADPTPTTAAALYRAIARAIGVRVLFVPVPRWTALLAVRAAGHLHRRLPVSEDNLRGLDEATVIDSTPSLERLGVPLTALDALVNRSRWPAAGRRA